MAKQDRKAFETLKARLRDGKISRKKFLLQSAKLGQSTAAYAWLNTPDQTLAPTAEVMRVKDPRGSDGSVRRLAEKADLVAFAPKPEQFAWTFGGLPPVMHVKPGQVLKLWTEDAFAGHIRTKKDVPSKVLKYPFVNPQTGPFYVEGAEVGDTLAIHLMDMQPARDWAASTTIPLF